MELAPLGNSLLCEFFIKTQDLSILDRFKIIKDIYNSILYKDNLWHFFYEDEMGDIIRCSPNFSRKIKKYLKEHHPEIKYIWNSRWIETIKDVIDNPEYFARLFNLNSGFIVNNAFKFDNGLITCIDRFSHSLYLNYFFSLGEFKEKEASILSVVLLNRSFYDGLRFQYLKDKKYMENRDGSKN